MADQYKAALFRDISYWSRDVSLHSTWHESNNQSVWQKLKTIYFGWWTPLLLWAQYLIDILDEVAKHFDLSELQELTIECNPYPYKDTLNAVQTLITTYAHLPRVRFSFGIQSLDDAILQQSNRDCTFAGLQAFTHDLLAIKEPHVLYNYDFIAFGDTNILPPEQQERLRQLISSHQLDSFSLYTLELFPGAKRYHETKDPLIAYQAPWDHTMPFATNEDSIFDQFDALKKLFLAGWYARYEISNYALLGKECVHNIVYWTMQPYIGIWLWAHGFITSTNTASNTGDAPISYRTENTWWWKQYISSSPELIYKKHPSTQHDMLVESFFLWLRYNWVQHVSQYATILKSWRSEAINTLVSHWLCVYEDDILELTDTWKNIHHQICTYLMETI